MWRLCCVAQAALSEVFSNLVVLEDRLSQLHDLKTLLPTEVCVKVLSALLHVCVCAEVILGRFK